MGQLVLVQSGVVNPVTDIASGIPCFSAYQTTAQTLNTTAVKLTMNGKEFDTTSNYDNVTNYRYTPNVAGYYHVSLSLGVLATNVAVGAHIAKNGSVIKYGASGVGGIGMYSCSEASCTVYMNGTTDYLEAFGQATSAVSINNIALANKFQAHLIVGA